MKLKLLILSIVAIIGLVGYKTYRDTTELKAINSYDACLASKGSLLQESYPATCVTRIGTHFIQPLSEEEKQKLVPPSEFTN